MNIFRRKNTNDESNENVEEISVFEKSLNDLVPDDIAKERNERSAFDLFSAIRIFLIIVCLSVFAYCVYLLIDNLYQYKKANDIYSDISAQFFDMQTVSGAYKSDGVIKLSQASSSVAIPIFEEALKLDDSELGRFYSEGLLSYNMEFQRMRSKLLELKGQNSEIVGFIHVEGTKISYPVTKHADNEYYLDHSFDKKPLKSGTIFMDYRNDEDLLQNKNIVMYGHNMKNGSMFGQVSKFYNSEELFRNTPIIIYAFDGIYTFEVFSVYKTVSNYQYFKTAFESDADFLSFANEMQGNSIYSKDIKMNKDDTILTLSTCTNTTKTGRFVLHAKLTRIDN